MANIKSAEKRARTKGANCRNRAYKSAVKSAAKFEAARVGDIEQARKLKVEKQLDKAANKGVIHKNTAAKKSKLAKKLNKAM